jgi:LacI family transcriptional regulator
MKERELAMPTIADVAAHACVSTATVSRVLNRPDAVRDVLQKRVLDAVTRLGYVPNSGARALKLQRSGTVGAVFPTIDNAIFAKAIDALQQRLAESGRQLLIATSGYDPQTEMQQAINLVRRGADALALCGNRQSRELMQFLRQRELPIVHAMTISSAPDRVCVGYDNSFAIGKVVRYLLDLGHRRFGMLAGLTSHNERAADRLAGARQALAQAGLHLDPECLVEMPYTLSKAREGFRRLMQSPNPPTAVLCGIDVLAIGALLEAKTLGIDVPKQVSVSGFDDLEIARHFQPSLTTLHVPTERMWQMVADRIIASLEQLSMPRVAQVEVELIVRSSTGPAPTS